MKSSEDRRITWRTPKSEQHGDGRYNEEFALNGFAIRPSGQPVELTLENQVLIREIYPTPTTHEFEHPGFVVNEKGRRIARNGGQDHSLGLSDVVKYPTPIAHDAHKGVPTPDLLFGNDGRDRRTELTNFVTYTEKGDYSVDANEKNAGQLSPDWTEWLMGWPIGWTDLKPMSKERFEHWKESVLNGSYWEVDPAELPRDAEGYLPRLTEDRELRASRLKAIGNGQVPLCVLIAHALMAEE